MWPWERPRSRSIVHGDWKLLEALAGYGAAQIERQRLHAMKSAEPMLGGDLPSRRRAHQFSIRFVADGTAGGDRQPIASAYPPY